MITCTGCRRHFSVRGFTQHVYSTSREPCILAYRKSLEQQANEEALEYSTSSDEDMEQGEDEETSEHPGMSFSGDGECGRDDSELDPWPEDGDPDDTVGMPHKCMIYLYDIETDGPPSRLAPTELRL